MKRVGFLMERIVSLDNLYLAFQKTCRGKHRSREVLEFSEHFDDRIRSIRQDLLSGTFQFGDYHQFRIHDPKERLISAPPLRERVAHHAIMNVCGPYFDRTLIDSTYATRKGKGTYAALEHAQRAMSHYRYSVKLDVRKYYDSIDHQELKRIIGRLFKDPGVLALLYRIIDSYSVSQGRGLPMGNLTSQYLANLYLSGLDHRCKQEWNAAEYIRYMDDILIFGDCRQDLAVCVDQMAPMPGTRFILPSSPRS